MSKRSNVCDSIFTMREEDVGLWPNKKSLNAPRTEFPGDHSGLEPPDPIPNSEVKQSSADDSVGSPHVKVGHRQGFIAKKRPCAAFFLPIYFVR